MESRHAATAHLYMKAPPLINKILAADLVAKYPAAALIGLQIITCRYGDWPGGLATIMEVAPEPDSPEIVLWVKSERHGEIGVFEFEEVGLLQQMETRKQ